MNNQNDWKDIPEYEGYYEINRNSEIRSKERVVESLIVKTGTVRKIKRSSKPIKKRLDHKGYWIVILSKNSKPKTLKVHRLLMITFVGKSDLVVNHKNGVRTDNRLENLEYCTHRENILHGRKYLGHNSVRGELCGASKLNEIKVLAIVTLNKSGFNFSQISKLYNVNRQSIANVCQGKTWGHITAALVN